MKRKILLFLMLIMFAFSSVNVAFASNGTLTLGEKASFNIEPDDFKWFNVEIVQDGLYEFECKSNQMTGMSHGAGIEIWNQTGDVFIATGIYKENAMEQISTSTIKLFLNSGKYTIRSSGNGKSSVEYKRLETEYQTDNEPNDNVSNAIQLHTNKWYSGYVDGKLSDGTFDQSDMYIFQAEKDISYNLSIEATGEISLLFHKLNENGSSETLYQKTAKENQLEKKWKLNEEISFSEEGTYYIEAVGRNRYNSSYTEEIGYKFIFGNEENSNSIKSPETTSTTVGVKINWENTNNTGFRVYRAEAGGVPVAVSGIVYGNSFVDVNVESDKKYYYMVVPETENSVPVVDEKTSSEAVTETILQPENTGIKNFILMKIGNPNMTVGDKVLEIDPGRGTVPLIQNGRTLVPIRAIIEAMNGTVAWNENERKVTLNANGHNVQMWLGKKEFIVDGVTKQMDIAPDAINGRTMLPIRFVTENVGCQIEWIGSTQEIIIVF